VIERIVNKTHNMDDLKESYTELRTDNPAFESGQWMRQNSYGWLYLAIAYRLRKQNRVWEDFKVELGFGLVFTNKQKTIQEYKKLRENDENFKNSYWLQTNGYNKLYRKALKYHYSWDRFKTACGYKDYEQD